MEIVGRLILAASLRAADPDAIRYNHPGHAAHTALR